MRKSNDADDGLDKRFGSPDVGSDLETGIQEGTNGVPKHIDIILAVDLNSRYPGAAFIAPCLGYFHCTTLSVFDAMVESKKATFANFKYDPDASKSSQFGPDWKNDFLLHCKALLRLKLGKSLEYLRLQISLTTRSDISDRDKAMLARAVEDAGICTKDTVRIIPTVEAVTIEAIWDSLASYTNGAPNFENGDNILVVHNDGDVVEIQSYSISLPATARGLTEFRLQMIEMACGETVDWGEKVDQQFTRWMQSEFGNSFLELPEKDTGPNSQLMLQFTKFRREYKITPDAVYAFPLMIKSPPSHAPYDADRHICQVEDSLMETFFRSAVDSLYQSLARHNNTVRKNNMSINKIILIGVPNNSPYIEQQLIRWESAGSEIHSRGSSALPAERVQPLVLTSTPYMSVQGATLNNRPNVEILPRSRACYGFALGTLFVNGDPEWSRVRSKFDDIDLCSAGIIWQVKKNQRLDPNALGSEDLCTDYEEEEFNCVTHLEVYKCELDDPPRWVRSHENIPNPGMRRIATAIVKFGPEDLPYGEMKLCSDQVRRRRLRFKAVVNWPHGRGIMRVSAQSTNTQRELGFANITFFEEGQ